ncbi:[Acyl-carrier-protein] S-malonyltransferase [Clostridium cavendishii DSM 21758]|uniref:Malonyl CoA-acyl carrier protein transacylase n=1 Tax=Clostridium cavendishii DSM 21758 TaxID=1121302 RepID=A0A1M6KHP8_9CLOT|nr:ACP S-malonyltransferase [Clostridium cavendishii]SHJ58454.1 [Acyl-carrier-protein] S-malonyltransferase [Clostridium cavendishii DSM 21758]
MKKIGFLFAGQGAQYPGMGRDLYENYEECKKVFEVANKALGFDIKEICFNGSKDELGKTEITQPAILAVNMAALKILKENHIEAYASCGLSLGEYSALIYGGVLNFEEALPLVNKRGKFMQEAVPLGVGGMVAILGLKDEIVEEVLKKASYEGKVEAANYNCPGQIVVAGENKALDKVIELSKELRGKAKKLPVSAPFHSSLLKPAADKLMDELNKVTIKRTDAIVMSNVLGDIYPKGADVRELLKTQVMASVLFKQNIEKMIAMGIDTFVEIGPGKTLGGFVKKIKRDAIVLNVEDKDSLENTIKVIKG